MKRVYLRILEILFPRSQDQILLERTTDAHFLQKYLHAKTDDVVHLSSFKDQQIRAALHLNKFHQDTRARKLLALLLVKYITQLPQNEYILIPIPLSSKRERARGYNQVTIVAQTALNECTVPVVLVTTLLKRTRDTKPQTSLSKEKRHTNLLEAFTVSEKDGLQLTDKHLILLDDVTTTGATFHEAKTALLLHLPSSITCVALAG
jgi:competence protein ComFC